MPSKADQAGLAGMAAQNIVGLTDQTLAPLLLALTSWPSELRAIVLSAVGRRALELAAAEANR